jgi:hypothetical protein
MRFSVTDRFFINNRIIKEIAGMIQRLVPNASWYWSRTNGRKKLEELMLAFMMVNLMFW